MPSRVLWSSTEITFWKCLKRTWLGIITNIYCISTIWYFRCSKNSTAQSHRSSNITTALFRGFWWRMKTHKKMWLWMYHLVTLSILHEEALYPCVALITLKNFPVYLQVFFRVWEIHSAENLPSAAQLHTDPEPVLTNVAPPIAPPTGLRESGPFQLISLRYCVHLCQTFRRKKLWDNHCPSCSHAPYWSI